MPAAGPLFLPGSRSDADAPLPTTSPPGAAPGRPHRTYAVNGLEWVTPHTFGKTVATAQLGHGNKEIPKKHYIVMPALAPDSFHILEQRGASPPAIMGRPGRRNPAPTNA